MITRGPTLPFLAARDQSVETRSRIETLNAELSSGRRADVGRAVSSDFSSISRITHDLRVSEARTMALGRAATWLETTQTALNALGRANQHLMTQLPATLTPVTSDSLESLASTARMALVDMGAALAVTQGGRSIFAPGSSEAEPPLKVDVMLAETAALAQGASDYDEFMDAMDAYFAPGPGAGIEVNAIPAYDVDAASFALGAGKSIAVPVSLTDPGIRATLKQAAIMAALPELSAPIKASFGPRLSIDLPSLNAQAAAGLVTTQSRVGTVEERVGRLAEGLAAEVFQLEGRRSEVLAADPFTTATSLQNEMTRLETIFAVTARRARLRLMDYMR